MPTIHQLRNTLADTIAYLIAQGRVPATPRVERRRALVLVDALEEYLTATIHHRTSTPSRATNLDAIAQAAFGPEDPLPPAA